MKSNVFHVKLIEEISRKIPQRNKMVNVLMDMLGIEREAVYRRLRGEVPFSFNEVAAISQRLSLSIDALVDITSANVSPFRLQLMEFTNPDDTHFETMDQLMRFIDFINNPETEGCDATNILPKGFYFRYESLTRFYLFKWQYHYADSYRPTKYGKVELSGRMKEYYDAYVKASHKLGTTRYILDFRLFENLVNDLRYFRGIHMITDEELIQIKKDLLSLLDYLEALAISGKYQDTGNRVLIYISSLNFESCYSYVTTTTYHISFLKTFILNTVVSFDKKTYDKIRNWTHSQIKSSTLITESGEMDRIRYFHAQRECVNSL